MANVEPYVQQIRQAIYGEQVRESIARSIEEMNQDNIDTQSHYDTTIAAANTAITNANNAADAATDIKDEVEQKLADGDFDGPQGPTGDAATITVGSVTTGAPGTAAQVVNTGTSSEAVLQFTIPRGATGEIENLDTAAVTFGIDTNYQNIASGMTVAQLQSRIQLLLDMIMLTDTQANNLNTLLGLASGTKLPGILESITRRVTKVDYIGSEVTVTPNSGYTVHETHAYRYGNVINLMVFVSSNTATAPGSNMFNGTLTGHRPATNCRAAAYYGASAIIGEVTASGTMGCRVTGATTVAANGKVLMSFFYLEE